jgi:hypothetical protein
MGHESLTRTIVVVKQTFRYANVCLTTTDTTLSFCGIFFEKQYKR